MHIAMIRLIRKKPLLRIVLSVHDETVIRLRIPVPALQFLVPARGLPEEYFIASQIPPLSWHCRNGFAEQPNTAAIERNIHWYRTHHRETAQPSPVPGTNQSLIHHGRHQRGQLPPPYCDIPHDRKDPVNLRRIHPFKNGMI